MTRIAFVFALAAAACSSSAAVEIDVVYPDDWGLTELQLSGGGQSSAVAPSHRVTVLVPDEWAGTPTPISFVGMRAADSWAQATVVIVPERGQTVRASAHLSLLSCSTSCVENGAVCVTGGLATCEQQPDSCFGLSAPIPCERGTRCSGNGCVPGDLVVLPSNSETLGTLESTGIAVDVEDGYIFDTGAECYQGSALGNCAPVMPPGAPEVCVCRADSVKLQDFEVRGRRALAILAWTSVTVQGNLVVKPGAGVAAAYTSPGSAGGSYGTLGGSGGARAFGNAEIVPLSGGMTGQGKTPGLGGGALQITADQMVRVAGTISAPGGGAPVSDCKPASAPLVGDGGGSGGGILLEARHVVITGGVAANGGGGASGGLKYGDGRRVCGQPGSEGAANATAVATGGKGPFVWCRHGDLYETVGYGGNGGAGSLGETAGGDATAPRSGSDSTCSDTVSGVTGYAAGGGGGAGRIRINTFADACGCTGFLSPAPTYGMLRIE